MGYRESKNEILELIAANYKLIHVVAKDEVPVIKTLITMAENKMANDKIDYNVMTWNIADGGFMEYGNSAKVIERFMTKNAESMEGKVKALYSHIKNCKENTVFVLQDFDFLLREHKELSFGLKEVIQTISRPFSSQRNLKRYNPEHSECFKHIVIVSSTQYIPEELKKLVNLVEFNMPGREEIEHVIDEVAKAPNLKLDENEREKVISAAYGLTETELYNALLKSIVTEKRISSEYIVSLKKQIIKKGGFIEYSDPIKDGIDSLGGMNNLKEWVKKRSIAFDEKIRKDRKLDFPKGLLLTGVQGGGKSHAAKSIAGFLGLPLLRFDIGKVKGMYVGQSEENMREAIQLAESVAPSVLWIDEVEKAFSDPKNANTHEVSKGLLGQFLTWMQEKKKPVFVVATANSIDTLPPEFMRKGRFDEIFWVDLPDEQGRKEIAIDKLKRRNVNPDTIDVDAIAKASEGYTGAEIEAAINEGNFNAAYDDKPLSTKYILDEISNTSPISVIRKDAIEEMQEWADKHNVRNAS